MAEDIFPEPLQLLPPSQAPGASAGWLIRFRSDDADELPGDWPGGSEPRDDEAAPSSAPPRVRPGPVRHAAGYGRFAEAVERLSLDPIALAHDLSALLDVMSGHPGLLASEPDIEAARIFFGNALALLNPNASWRRTPALEVGSSTRSIDVALALTALLDAPERRGGFFDSLASWQAEDAQHDLQMRAMDAATDIQDSTELRPLPEPFELRLPAAPAYHDEQSEVIPYGERWPNRAPEDAYSRVSHPERFALLHDVALDLVAYLERCCGVTVQREVTLEGERVLRLEPATGASIRIRLTRFPGLVVSAGALWARPFPDCGCDACDETGSGEAEAFVEAVLGVVAGGLTERFPIGAARRYAAGLRTSGGSSGSSGDATGSPEELRAAEGLLAALRDGRWPAWPQRDPA